MVCGAERVKQGFPNITSGAMLCCSSPAPHNLEVLIKENNFSSLSCLLLKESSVFSTVSSAFSKPTVH